MKNKLVIIGASGHGKVVADIAMNMKKWEEIFFLDDNKEIRYSMGIDVIGTSAEILRYVNDYDIFVGIGDNSIRQRFKEMISLEGASIPTLIHPKAIIGEQVEIGAGTVIMAGSIINCNTKIGKGCIINTGATIDHDNVIDDYVHVSPGVHLAGSVRVGRNAWLGIGSIVSNNLEIASECKIGAGSVVISNLLETGTYIGIPARRI